MEEQRPLDIKKIAAIIKRSHFRSASFVKDTDLQNLATEIFTSKSGGKHNKRIASEIVSPFLRDKGIANTTLHGGKTTADAIVETVVENLFPKSPETASKRVSAKFATFQARDTRFQKPSRRSAPAAFGVRRSSSATRRTPIDDSYVEAARYAVAQTRKLPATEEIQLLHFELEELKTRQLAVEEEVRHLKSRTNPEFTLEPLVPTKFVSPTAPTLRHYVHSTPAPGLATIAARTEGIFSQAVRRSREIEAMSPIPMASPADLPPTTERPISFIPQFQSLPDDSGFSMSSIHHRSTPTSTAGQSAAEDNDSVIAVAPPPPTTLYPRTPITKHPFKTATPGTGKLINLNSSSGFDSWVGVATPLQSGGGRKF